MEEVFEVEGGENAFTGLRFWGWWLVEIELDFGEEFTPESEDDGPHAAAIPGNELG